MSEAPEKINVGCRTMYMSIEAHHEGPAIMFPNTEYILLDIYTALRKGKR